MQLFYTPDIDSDTHELNAEESKHCIRVLRRKKGDIIQLTDGRGNLYNAELMVDDPKKCLLRIIETKSNFEKRNFNIHLAVAPTKNISRLEWFLEKATEIGIDEITPLFCENSERRAIKHDRLQKVIISALKQSLKAYIPKLNKAVNFSEFIQKEYTSTKYIAFIDENVTQTLQSDYRRGEDVLILIGPEGDFSMNEISLSKQHGFYPISLGKSRLRTETAAIVACHAIHVLNEEL